ncbi:MAG: multi antimicrobial extrusion protein MatE, partial [Micromonosporaceae bacterium]
MAAVTPEQRERAPETPEAPPPGESAPRARGLAGVARGGALNLTGAGYSAIAGFAVTALVARGLGPHEAGMFFTATTLFVIAAVVIKLGAPT